MRVVSNGKIYRSEEEWRGIFRRLESSGLTQREFCEKENLSLASLHKWQKKLGGVEEGPSFIEVSAAPSVGKQSAVELRFPSGLVVSIGG